ncbi:MAG: flagellar hook assembly protein FlgD [Deltaproteobacteria bacterium]|nr:flagellar hook assembly protein FlgD [Deltaproteobacteria bacterium]
MAIAALEPIVQNQHVADTRSHRDKLGRSDFLKMFITQMQFQDPLNPIDNTEFTAQLAQFSSLEQLFNINDNVVQMLNGQGTSARIQALNLIGKKVVAEGSSLRLSESSIPSASFVLNEDVSQCIVSIQDSQGRTVRNLPLGALEKGSHSFEWDGLDGDGQLMPEGVYTFRVLAKNFAGEEVTVSSRTSGIVTGVKLGGAMPIISVGDMEVSLSKIIAVEPAPATAANQSARTS